MTPYTEVLEEHRNGRTMDEATEALAEVVRAVTTTQKGGAVVVTLNIKPNGAGAVELDAKVVAKMPEAGRERSTYYTDADGSLSRRDPRQLSLPDLKEIGTR